MSKFFLKGPIPLLPQNAPLGGLLSIKFVALLIIHLMFACRTIALEHALLSSYRIFSYYKVKPIEPLIPQEYRLIVYFIPCFISLFVNIYKLSTTTNGMLGYFKNYPQFVIGPMFSPIMFEGNSPTNNTNNQHPLRIWKLGTIINSLFIGCLPPIILLVSDHIRGIPSWKFNDPNDTGVSLDQESTSLIKSPYGNTYFAVTTFLSFLVLTLIVFLNDTICKCTQPCLEPQTIDSLTSNNADEEDLASECGNNENISLQVFYNLHFI